jgi:uncharacterized protein
MAGRFIIGRASNDQFYFNLKAGNGEVLLTSQTFAAKGEAVGGIESVRDSAPVDGRFERTKNGVGYSFCLKTADGRVVGRSDRYTTAASREQGIAAVKNNALAAWVEDRSQDVGL